MYTIREFGAMIADTVRTRAYEEALRLAVTPGCTVVDIGAGTGILSMLACRMGAGRVYAIEPNDAICLAPELARANGCEDRIRFLQQSSLETSLAEPADVIVSDLRGLTPLCSRSVEAIIDARTRLLRPGGILIPRRDVLWAAPLACAVGQGQQAIWRQGYAGLDLSPVLGYATHEFVAVADIEDGQLAAEPKIWAELDYYAVTNASVANEMAWTADRPGVAHGIGLWFETFLAEGVSYANATACPTSPRATVYGAMFLPWPRPVALQPGDTVAADIRAAAGGDYLWSWRTTILEQGNPGRRKESFSQSNFFANPAVTPSALRQSGAASRPALGRRAQALRHVLNAMDGAASLEEIAAGLQAEFSELYPSLEQAMGFAGEVSRKHA
jgi:protein arginine N-methyltransferase 1